MSDQTLISYAQNGEDVVLWRALGHVSHGRYVDVGACDPVELSVTKALYDRSWRGVDIDPVPAYADRLREARPGNEILQAAITDRPVETVTFHQLVDTGLSTLLDSTAAAHEEAGFERNDITVPALTLDSVCERSRLIQADLHIVKIDVEGAEAEVLRSFDLRRWQPWVVVVEATRPLSNEPSYADWDPILMDAGYTFTLFDGLSRYYVSPDHPELVESLGYPACALDDYVPIKQHRQDVRVDQLNQALEESRDEVLRWRSETVSYWANAIAKAQAAEDLATAARSETERFRRQLSQTRATLQQVRGERRQLRARVKRMSTRIQRLSHRVVQLQAELSSTAPSRSRLRAVLRKATGS